MIIMDDINFINGLYPNKVINAWFNEKYKYTFFDNMTKPLRHKDLHIIRMKCGSK